MTLAADRRGDHDVTPVTRPTRIPRPPPRGVDNKPVEFWPTSAIRAAVESGDLTTWQRIAVALQRDPYGRTARQVEEVLRTVSSHGISEALSEVLARSRERLEAEELAEVARLVRLMLERSKLGKAEFAYRIGVSSNELTRYLDGELCPSATKMVRMRRLSDRFAKLRAQRPVRPQ